MIIAGNENTVTKLYKLCNKNDIANLKFRQKTSLNELFKNNNIKKLEVKINKSLLNNELTDPADWTGSSDPLLHRWSCVLYR